MSKNDRSKLVLHSKPIWAITIHETQGVVKDIGDAWDEINEYHKSLGWAGIGYHAIVHPDTGEYRLGRLAKYRGSHAKYKNNGNLGVAVLGTWHDRFYLPIGATVGLVNVIRGLTVGWEQEWKLYAHWEMMKKGHTKCGEGAIQDFVDEMNTSGFFKWK